MAGITVVISEGTEINYEGAVNIPEFLKLLRSWMKKHDYDITEKDYETSARGKLKTSRWRWECDKKPDDFNKYLLKIKFGMADGEEKTIDGEKVVFGKFRVAVDAEMERDYDDKWKKPGQKFLRAMYDRFFQEEKETKVSKRLKDDLKDLVNTIKQYLNLE